MRAARAKAKGIAKPTKPTYRTGGWISMAGCWSSGFRPCPLEKTCSKGTGAKGLVRKQSSATKKITLPISVAMTHGMSLRLRARFWKTVTALSSERIQPQSRSDPACPPQSAGTLKTQACSRLELRATNARSKRSLRSAASRPRMENVSSAKTA
jgi:hypothetical protein